MFSLFKPKSKRCFTCGVPQLFEDFHKDRTSKDGYAASCKGCRNAKRRKPLSEKALMDLEEITGWVDADGKPVILEKVSIEEHEKFLRPTIHVPIKGHCDIRDLFQAITDRHQSFYTISVSKAGQITLQTHGEPKRVWKGTDPKRVLEEASAS